MTNLKLTSSGSLVLGSNVAATLILNFITHSFLQNTELEVAFFSKISVPTSLSDITLRLRIIDSTTGDEVIKVQGIIDSDPDNLASIVAVIPNPKIASTQYFFIILLNPLQNKNNLLSQMLFFYNCAYLKLLYSLLSLHLFQKNIFP